MPLTVKCYATLACHQPTAEVPHVAGETVDGLIKRLGVNKADVKVVFVNSAHAEDDRVLHDGDRVGVFPAVGGG